MQLINHKVKDMLFYIGLFLILVWAVLLRIRTVDFDRHIVAGDESAYENAAENLLQYGMFTMDRGGNKRWLKGA